MADTQPTQTLDTSGKCCPMPMVETNKAIRKMADGEILELIATDPGTKNDIKSWCERMGHELVGFADTGSDFRYVIRKGA